MIAALIAIVLFVLRVTSREPAWLDTLSEPVLFALIGLVGGALMFRSFAAGCRFALAFLLYPFIAHALYELGRAIPYDGVILDWLTRFYFTLLMPAIACAVIGAIAMAILLLSPRLMPQGFLAFAIAGAIGGAVAPLLSWSLAQMATESALAALLALNGEELLRFFVAGFGLAWIMRGKAVP